MSQGIAESFGDDPARIIAVASTFGLLVSVAVLLRVYCRSCMMKAFGIDDGLLLMAFGLYVARCSVYIQQGRVERAKGISNDVLQLARLEVAFWVIYVLEQIFLKLALSMFFFRILEQRWQRTLVMLTTIFYTLFSIGFLFASLFRCGARHPGTISYFNTQCPSWRKVGTPLNTLHAGMNALVDIIFTVSPVILVIRTKMPARTKVEVCSLLAFAGLGSVVSVIRVPFMYKNVELAPAVFANEALVAILSLAETGIGLICLSVAALRPLGRVWAVRGRMMVASITHRQCKYSDPCSFTPLDLPEGHAQANTVEEVKVEGNPKFLRSKRVTPTTSVDAPTGIVILHTPGHTPESLACYDTESHLLSRGDSFYETSSQDTQSAS